MCGVFNVYVYNGGIIGYFLWFQVNFVNVVF